MQTIFTNTPGRCGTESLAQIFNAFGVNCLAEHEPHTGQTEGGWGEAMVWYDNGNEEMLKSLLPGMADRMQPKDLDAYVLSSHAFLKSLCDVAYERWPDLGIIHLSRDPCEVAISTLNHNCCPGRDDQRSRTWYIGPTFKRNVWQLDADTVKGLTEFQIALWYAFEMELRHERFLSEHDVKLVYDLDMHDLNDPAKIAQMFQHFGLSHRPIDETFHLNKGATPTQVSREHRAQATQLLELAPPTIRARFRKDTVDRLYTHFVEQPQHEIAVFILSCGRANLLARTIESLLATQDLPTQLYIYDDSGDPEYFAQLVELYGDKFNIISSDRNKGRRWATDFMVTIIQAPYIFYLEEDWIFLDTGYLQLSRKVLDQHREIGSLGMWHGAPQWGGLDYFRSLDGVGKEEEDFYYIKPYRLSKLHFRWYAWHSSPCLMRREDLLKLGRLEALPGEWHWDRKWYLMGLRGAWSKKLYVEHIGWGQSKLTVEHETFVNREGIDIRQMPCDICVHTDRCQCKLDWILLDTDVRLPDLRPVRTTVAPTPDHYRFHIPGLAHAKTNKDYVACAYTQKVLKLCKMLTDLGHTVYHYGAEGSNPVCTENVVVLSDETQQKVYGDHDWHKGFFKFDVNDEAYREFDRRTIEEIRKRMQPRDFLLCAWGHGHKRIADAVDDGNIMVVESGIGYHDTFAKYRIFESYAWMHHVYGRTGLNDGCWYDAVIPNFFDPNDFLYRANKDDYFLYFGRITKRKGVDIAAQVTREIGARLIVAGQGLLVSEKEQLNIDSQSFPNVEYVGHADATLRKTLMAGAKGLFCPTYYIEPFGGVAIEAQMSGTPIITTDWGAFTETVEHGVTGYRCRTYADFVWAARNIENIDPAACRQWAIENYAMGRVAKMYEEYFDKLYDLWPETGWYTLHPDQTDLDWMQKYHPTGVQPVEAGYYDRITAEETPQAQSLAQALIDRYRPTHVADVGCATGLYLAPFIARGIGVQGFDNSPDAIGQAVIPEDCITLADATVELPIKDSVDMVLCIEVLEHIAAPDADKALTNLCALQADVLVFSAAHVGQGGQGHVNCQPKEYWRTRIEALGYKLNQDATDQVLTVVMRGMYLGWLRMNLMIFERIEYARNPCKGRR